MKIKFFIHYDTKWGEALYITGSTPSLGDWDISKAPVMKYLLGGFWYFELESHDDELKRFEYRYFLKNNDGAILKENGENRTYLLGTPAHSVELRDSWRKNSDPNSLFLTSAFVKNILRRESKQFASPSCSDLDPQHHYVRFQLVESRIQPHQTLCIVGNIPSLGDWDEAKAVPMNDAEFPSWVLDHPFEISEKKIEYKYLIKDLSGNILFYEQGDNRVLEIGKGQKDGKKLWVVTDHFFRFPNHWRGAGITIPVFSLRTESGLGVGEFLDLKPMADWAAECGFHVIQILPINDTSIHLTWEDSFPYSVLSVFALHPLYLNIPAIGDLPLGMEQEVRNQQKKLNADPDMDYQEVITLKLRLAKQIYQTQKDSFLSSKPFKKFLQENAYWLKPYAAFCSLRDARGTCDFRTWGPYREVTEKDIEKLTSPKAENFDLVGFYYFLQYHLHLQLLEATTYATEKKVVLMGDIPIGVHELSESCWASPKEFNMNQFAGAPPDPFSDIGQNWGFPTYNWEEMAKNDYLWWRQRLRQMSQYFQMIRLDHVLGFFRIWEIPTESYSGLMGHFNPVIPIQRKELEDQGISDFERLCEPYITESILHSTFGEWVQEVKETYLEQLQNGRFRLKEGYRTQRDVDHKVYYLKNSSKEIIEKTERIKQGLWNLISNIILFQDSGGKIFHPRINLMNTSSFGELEPWMKEKLKELYINYFYHRQENFWREQAMKKLPIFKESSNMLICGEDLGMIPDCVPQVMEELCLLGLRIQRMPKETGREFSNPQDYSYITVCCTSTHDMSPLRGWWEEDRAKTQRFFNQILSHPGEAPHVCEPWIAKEIVLQHLHSPSMWAIFPIQDILSMSPELRRPGHPKEEQINRPAEPDHYWKYRLHLPIEKLIAAKSFNAELREMVTNSGRNLG